MYDVCSVVCLHFHISYICLDQFPLLTTKKVFWKAIVEELLWFIKVSVFIVETSINNEDYYYFLTVVSCFFTGIN